MILVESMLASLPCNVSICSRLKSFTSDVLHKGLSGRLPCLTVVHHKGQTTTSGIFPDELQRPVRQLCEKQVCTHALESIYEETVSLSKTMMNETDIGD